MPSNHLAKLMKLVPPPAEPLDRDESVLARNQRFLRIKFPKDFIDFGKIYGTGEFKSAYSWEVWSPYRPTYPAIVLEFARIWNIFKDAMEIKDMPYGIFPEVGGLMPFAVSGSGDYVCWITKGEPDKWTTVDMYQYEKGYIEELDMTFSAYFLNVLSRKHVLERHRNGTIWNPKTDLKFEQSVYFDQ